MKCSARSVAISGAIYNVSLDLRNGCSVYLVPSPFYFIWDDFGVLYRNYRDPFRPPPVQPPLPSGPGTVQRIEGTFSTGSRMQHAGPTRPIYRGQCCLMTLLETARDNCSSLDCSVLRGPMELRLTSERVGVVAFHWVTCDARPGLARSTRRYSAWDP